MVTPYSEEVCGGVRRRTFAADVPERELVWHFDLEHRRVRAVAECPGWMLQMDDCLPFPFPRQPYRIPAGVYHRVLRGTGELVVEIQVLDT